MQISGGEPTIHPEFFAVLDPAKRRPIKHLMVNTNGVRIAQDAEFARRLAEYMPSFEVYLQFDSLDAAPLSEPCAAPTCVEIRRRALEQLNEHESRPRWSSRSRKGSMTTRSARSSTSR